MHMELAAILEMLAVDRVQSVVGLCSDDPQAAGLLQAGARQGLLKVSRYRLRPTGYSRLSVPTDVAILSVRGHRVLADGRPVAALPLNDGIEHALGVGELRRALQIPPCAWTAVTELDRPHISDPMDHRGRGLPDAFADTDGMRLALEYDHGRYTAAQVRLKQEMFPHLADCAVWAAPTRRRAKWLSELGCRHVIVVPLQLGVYERRPGSQRIFERRGNRTHRCEPSCRVVDPFLSWEHSEVKADANHRA